MSKFEDLLKYEAPPGTIWVCGACGRNHHNRINVGDESCFLNAYLCYDTPEKTPVPGVDKWGVPKVTK